jgi:hypothetical protein
MSRNNAANSKPDVVAARARLALLREEFAGKAVSSDMNAEFWRVLSVERRRTLAALAGVDDREDFCKRRWELISHDNKLLLLACARDWARALAPARWVVL